MDPSGNVWLVTEWCGTCGTRHRLATRCPGDLPATEPERPGWSVDVSTPRGIERITVLLAPSYDLWRARVRTDPNVLWLVPGGTLTVKFVHRTRRDAERQAAEFIRAHAEAKGYTLGPTRGLAAVTVHREALPAAPRRVRFLRLRFGLAGPSEAAGTGNLSATGMFVLTDAPPDPGTRIRIVLEIDSRPVPLIGRVRWMRRKHYAGGAPGMGVQLIEPPRSYLRYIQALG